MRSIGKRMARPAASLILVLGCGGEASERDYGSPTAEQEVALGLQAAPALAERYGGLLDARDRQRMVDAVGELISAHVDPVRLPFGVDFHLLADSLQADLLSLPGGQIFMTYALVRTLETTPPVIAALLAHQLGHVTARHSVTQVSSLRFDGQSGAEVLARYSPEDEKSRTTTAVQDLITALLDIRYTEAEEIDADRRAVEFLTRAAADTLWLPDGPLTGMADPRSLASVLQQLAETPADGGVLSRFLARHPLTRARLLRLQAALDSPQQPSR